MTRCQVRSDDGPELVWGFIARQSGPDVYDPGGSICTCLCRQLIFRSEVPLKSAVGQACALHDFGDTDAIETLFAEELARGLENPLTIFRNLLPGHFHLDSFPLTVFMILVMIKSTIMMAIINMPRR